MIRLYAAVQRVSIDQAAQHAAERFGAHAWAPAYMALAQQEHEQRVWWDAARRNMAHVPSLARLIPPELIGYDMTPLLPHIGAVKGTALQRLVLPKAPDPHAWHMVMPAWTSYHTWCGCYVITADGVRYAPWPGMQHQHGFILMDAVSPLHQTLLIAASVPTACAMFVQAYHHGIDVAVTSMPRDTTQVPPVPTQQRVYVVHPTDIDTVRSALRDHGSRCVWYDQLTARHQSPMLQLKAMLHAHQPTWHAAASHIARMPPAQAASYLEQLGLYHDEFQKLLDAATPADRQRLTAHQHRIPLRRIIYDGHPIVQTEQGWIVEDRHLRICNAPFVIQDIYVHRDAQHQCVAHGMIYQGQQTIPFQAPLEHVQRHTEAWLQNEVFTHYGNAVFVAPRWGSKLFHIALAFHEPRTIYIEAEAAWSDQDTLLLPQCRISKGVVVAQPKERFGMCSGRNIVPLSESALRSLPEVLLYDTGSTDIWTMMLQLTASVFAHAVSQPAPLLTWCMSSSGTTAQIERIFQHTASDLPLLTCDLSDHTTLDQFEQFMAEFQRRSVFPCVSLTPWSASTPMYGAWMSKHAALQAIVAVSPLISAALATSPRLMVVQAVPYPSSSVPDFSALRPYWGLAAHFWAHLQKYGYRWSPSQTAIQQLTAHMFRWLASLGYEYPQAVQAAVQRLGWIHAPRLGTQGQQLVRVFIEAHKAGLLAVRTTETHCEVSHAAYAGVMAQLQLPARTHEEACDMLVAASCLDGIVVDQQPGYCIPLSVWNDASTPIA